MEKDNKTTKKLKSIFWFSIYAIPFILLIYYGVFIFRNNQITDLLSNISEFVEDLADTTFITQCNGLFSRVLDNVLYSAFNLRNDFTYIICALINWYILTTLIHLVVDLLLFIPNVCKELLTKFTK